MIKETVTHSYLGILLSNRKQKSVNTQLGWISRTLCGVKTVNLQRLHTVYFRVFNSLNKIGDQVNGC